VRLRGADRKSVVSGNNVALGEVRITTKKSTSYSATVLPFK